MDLLQAGGCNEQVHVLSEAPIPVEELGHATHHGERNAEFVEAPGYSPERLVDRVLLLKVHAPLPERPVHILIELPFVSDHASPPGLLDRVGSGLASALVRPRSPRAGGRGCKLARPAGRPARRRTVPPARTGSRGTSRCSSAPTAWRRLRPGWPSHGARGRSADSRGRRRTGRRRRLSARARRGIPPHPAGGAARRGT